MDQSYKCHGLYISQQTKFHIDDTKNFYYKSTIFEILCNRKTPKAINCKHILENTERTSSVVNSNLKYFGAPSVKSRLKDVILNNFSRKFDEDLPLGESVGRKIPFFMKTIYKIMIKYRKNVEDFCQEKIKDKLLENVKRQKQLESNTDLVSGSKSARRELDSFKVPDDPSYHKGGEEIKSQAKQLQTKKQPLDKFMILDLIKDCLANSPTKKPQNNNGPSLAGTLHINSKSKLFGLDLSHIKASYDEVDQKSENLTVHRKLKVISMPGDSIDSQSFDSKNNDLYFIFFADC